MTDHPLGYTAFELREARNEPHAWVVEDDVLECETRIDDHEDWVATASFYVGKRGIQLVGLSVTPATALPWPPSSALSTSVLRKCHLDRLHRIARDWLEIRQEVGLGIETDAQEFHRNRRPGPVGRPDLFYPRAAFRYVELMNKGLSPNTTLAKERNISQSSARDLIHEARQRGLLTSTTRGQKGGQLTEKAMQLLNKNQGQES